MVRWIGGCMIFSGCLGIGLWYRSQLMGRIRALRFLQEILELLAGEIRYGCSTLPECCRRIAARLQTPFDSAFFKIDARMQENTGVSFAEVFRECMAEPLKALPLKEDDREIFLRFVPKNGFPDGQMQLRAIEQSRKQLENTIEELESENVEKCRMAVGLGVMSGLLIILVLM
ncbi:MAG: stage III sporulation protein AB [Acetatifactor sp.]|nr:stage III sporulation protein AB [Acetatifactor sp.]